jgi:hypothetical protein
MQAVTKQVTTDQAALNLNAAKLEKPEEQTRVKDSDTFFCFVKNNKDQLRPQVVYLRDSSIVIVPLKEAHSYDLHCDISEVHATTTTPQKITDFSFK